jgi:hypothetical protein
LTIKSKISLSRGIRAPLTTRSKIDLSRGVAWAAVEEASVIIFR